MRSPNPRGFVDDAMLIIEVARAEGLSLNEAAQRHYRPIEANLVAWGDETGLERAARIRAQVTALAEAIVELAEAAE